MLAFLTIVGAVLLGLVVVVIYLNDRVNELERRTAAAGSGDSGPGDEATWHGLSGKRLWDAMTGKKGVHKLDDATLQDLRTSYQAVLAKHIESLFQAGQTDARKGHNMQPTSTKTVPSERGSVQSWIPLNHANAIYRAGCDSIKEDIFEAERARMSLDEAAQILFNQAFLPLAQPFSDLLMASALPGSAPGADAAAGASAAGAGTANPQAAQAGQAAPSIAGPAGTAPSAIAAAQAALGAPTTGGMFSASAPRTAAPAAGAAPAVGNPQNRS